MSAALATLARDAIAYSVQLAAVVVTGLALSGLLRLRAPRVRLAVAQGLLVLAVALPWLQPWRPRPGTPAGVTLATTAAQGEAGGALDLLPVLGGGLVVGATWGLTRLLRRLWRLRGYRRVARALPPLAVVEEASARAGARAHMAVSDQVAAPAAFGVRWPLVLLPARFLGLTEEAQRAVLCHELVHVRRRDWLQMLAEEVTGALLWFHPAVWWLLARVRLAREQVVDEEVVHLTRERRVYLETLVGLAGVSGPTPAAAPLFLTESHLKRRVEALLEEVKMSKTHLRTGLAVSVAGVALAGVAAVRAFPIEGPGGAGAGVQEGRADANREAEAGAKKQPERKLVHKVNPAYPAEAKEKGIEGLVQIAVLVTAGGEVKEARVTKGPSDLRESAVSAVKQWRYEAAPHDTHMTLTINYRLAKDEEKPRP